MDSVGYSWFVDFGFNGGIIVLNLLFGIKNIIKDMFY